jgi:signal transduction histidine kinase
MTSRTDLHLRKTWRLVALTIGYGASFVLLHHWAATWGEAGAFSLWFPAAGLRFAVLWASPLRVIPLVALTEPIALYAAYGGVPRPNGWMGMIGSLTAPLSYGVAVALVRRLITGRGSSLSTPPMPLGLAMILAPVLAIPSVLPAALFAAQPASILAVLAGALREARVYWLGDVLGILMIAPPLLWLQSNGLRWPGLRMSSRLRECIAVVLVGWASAALVSLTEGRLHVEPVLLSAVWVALRLGRMAAWLVSATAMSAILIDAGRGLPVDQWIALHFFAAALWITSYLVGSYADAERQMQQELKRTQRLLLRADRLKTLRAMSLAAIHDISQPLSTLGIEARHVRELAEQDNPDRGDMIETSQLIERKTGHLAELVHRMRRFGSEAGRDATPIRVAALLADVAALTQSEAVAAGTKLQVAGGEGCTLVGREVELQQALVNLVRNAISAAPGGEVLLRADNDEEMLRLEVTDSGTSVGAAGGMGLGLIVVRTIVEAHGGVLMSERLEPSGSRYVLCLPRGGEA